MASMFGNQKAFFTDLGLIVPWGAIFLTAQRKAVYHFSASSPSQAPCTLKSAATFETIIFSLDVKMLCFFKDAFVRQLN